MMGEDRTGKSLTRRISKFLLVRPNELGTTSYFFLFYLFIGICLAIGRSTADALFIKRFGIEYLPVMYLVLSITLMLISTGYAAFSDRLSPERMFRIIFTGMGVLVALNWLVIVFTGQAMAYPVYFIVYEISSELLLVHASLYLGQNLELQQLKRLSPIIFAGAQIGIIAGGIILALFSQRYGVENMILVWVACITICIMMLLIRHKQQGASPYYRSPPRQKRIFRQAINQVSQGLVFARRSALLRSISASMFFMVIAYFTLSYSVNLVYNSVYPTEEALSAFFGLLNASCSLAALVIQVLLTNRLLHNFGVKTVNLIYPITTLFSFALLMVTFTLPAALFGSFNKDTLTPAIRTPARNIFFNALPGYIQGRARAMTIALVMPAALIVTGSLLLFAQQSEQPILFMLIGAGAAIAYLYSNLRMNHHYIQSMIDVLREKLYLPEKRFNAELVAQDELLLQELSEGLAHEDRDICLSYARLLLSVAPQQAARKILGRACHSTDEIAIPLLKLLRHADISEVTDDIAAEISRSEGDRHHTLLTVLLSHGMEIARDEGLAALASTIPTLQVAGVLAAHHFGNTEERSRADLVWQELLSSANPVAVSAGLEISKILKQVPSQAFIRVLSHADHNLRSRALQIINAQTQLPDNSLEDPVARLTGDPVPENRSLALRCLVKHWPLTAQTCAEQALEDEHPAVSAAGVRALFDDSAEGLAVLKAWVIGNAGSPRAQRTAFEALADRTSDTSLWQSVTHTRIEDINRLSQALHVMLKEDNSPYAELVRHVIKERLKQTVELALFAMGRFEDRKTLEVIRACLSTNDRQHIANACEILRNLPRNNLALQLSDILELHYSNNEENIEHCMFNNSGEVLAWCRTRSDKWLSQCAEHAASQIAFTA